MCSVNYHTVSTDSEIIKVFPDSALLLRLTSDLTGFAPLPMVYDERRDKLDKKHQLGTRHHCRVIQFNLIDGTAIVSLQPSILSQRYLRYSDISAGDLLDATVQRHGGFGMILTIQGNIRGLCPSTHISDRVLRDPQRKLQPGKTVKCRVLHVAAEEKRVLLTCKKSLLQLTDEEILSEYTQAVAGRVFKGVVSQISNHGFTVFFFNNVMGYVPKSEMVGEGGGRFPIPSSVVRPGQVVECRVLTCEPGTKRLRLSQRLDSEATPDVTPEDQLRPGMRVRGEVAGVAADGVTLRCRENGEFGFLPVTHLSDYPSLSAGKLSQHQQSLAAAVREGIYTLSFH